MPTNRKPKADKAVTRQAIDRAYGLLKRQSGGKTFVEEWSEHKREELELEKAKCLRFTR
jgi:hypothetical protein